ncbi:hypothetical protein D3C81_1148270 [compost metagenome]
MTTPEARPSATAFSSSNSAWIEIASSRLSMPAPVLAEISTICVSPPKSSATTCSASSSFLTRIGSAEDLSILLIATTIGALAARACLMASLVCGITPSSAATTTTTTSVSCAPRARIEVNAAWPGVSRKLITPFGVST